MKLLRGDMHVDTLEYALDNNLDICNRKLNFNTVDVKEYLPYIQLFACFVHDSYIEGGYSRVNKILDYYYAQQKENNNLLLTIKSGDDINKVVSDNKVGAVLTIENGKALDGKEDNLYRLFERYVRIMTITWNINNELGCGCQTLVDTGLTSFGKRCIKIMNDISMIIDVSHSSIKTFNDIINYSTKPIIASHSNVYSLCKNKRNLTDDQIKQIAENNGIIGVSYYSKFLTGSTKSSIKDVVNHIKYISNLVGVKHVCLGSDFDGIDSKYLPQNIKGVKDINKIEECLLFCGFDREDIKDIMGRNLQKFLQNNLI